MGQRCTYHQHLLSFILIITTSTIVHAGIHTLDGTQLLPDKTYSVRTGIYSPDEAPASTNPGNGKAYISVSLSLERNEAGTFGQLHALIFHSSKKSKIGVLDADKKVRMCCNQDLRNAKKCENPGDILVSPSEVDNKTMWLDTANFSINSTTSSMNQAFGITTSGVYYVYLVNCKSSDTGVVTFQTGEITFMNPYGYLNAEYYPFMPFYAVLAALYLVLGITWFVMSVRRRKQLLTLQNCIAGVIVLGMIESATFYFDYLGYNVSGKNYIGAMIVGVLMSTLKRTVSRILVLVVSMGYGVVKPTLGTTRYKVLILGILYLLFSGALNVVDLVQRNTVVTFSVMFFLVFPVALFDTSFYWWIFVSLLRTISQLQTRKQSMKLSMYKSFFVTLVASGVVSAFIILVQLFLTVSLDSDASWRFAWLWSAIWHLLYMAILMAIAVLWRPTDNNTRYAYSEMAPEPDEFMLQPLHVFGEAVQRKGGELGDDLPQELKLDPNMATSFTIEDEELQGKLD